MATLAERGWFAPVVAWLCVATFNLTTAALRGVFTVDQAIDMWWHVIDAKIPTITAEWALGRLEFLPGWSPFDRGPVQPALLIGSGAIFGGPVVVYAVGVIANSAWVVGLWALLRTLEVRERVIAVAASAVALCGPVWINTVYPWPKLLAAAFCLGATAAILRGRPALAGGLALLAMLSHGSALFALVGLLPIAIYRLRRRIIPGLAIFLIPMAAWALVPTFASAPGQPRLAQWHLAGTDIRTPDLRDPVTSMVTAYRDAGLGVLANKVTNARVVIGDTTFLWGEDGAPTRLGDGAMPAWVDERGGFQGRWRAMQLTSLALAPGILLLGLFWWRRAPRMLWLLVGAWTATYVLLEWGGDAASAAWLHTAPLAAVVALGAACAIGLRRWALPVAVVYFLTVWLFAPPVWP